ncbi:MAG TPA: M28 family peptidase [Luteibaculaceae bacterium]|nr:M28 family peptidase [Luteibaculaceae bacterium]
MMLRYALLSLLTVVGSVSLYAQTNILFTNPDVDRIMKGQYNPQVYLPNLDPTDHDQITSQLVNNVSPDSLKAIIIKLASFKNRNTGADTVSDTEGIGAARRWVYQKFEQYSAQNQNKLQVSYHQFDQAICSVNQHRNIVAALPGADTTDHGVIIIEGHIDSRCQGVCDINCVAEGVEDNASGTALVMELARVMSGMTFNKTILFAVVIGEEQGLFGGNALAQYCRNQNIKLQAVLNNDVIGGIICGKTSSAPSCPGLNDIDSTQVRLFSSAIAFSDHKNLSRYIKMEYQDELTGKVSVPMNITIMAGEDRVGRGGDHIPFRQLGFPAMRFTSANEHGDASNGPEYDDRQHTESDILGLDTDNDAVIDSFFVDFNYLARNAVINANAAAMIAIGPKKPAFTLSPSADNKLKITVTEQTQYGQYRVGLRTGTNTEFDSLFVMNGITDSIPVELGKSYFVSVASIDENGVESLFATEKRLLINPTGVSDLSSNSKNIELLQNKPNPFDESTVIGFIAGPNYVGKNAAVEILDLQGRVIKTLQSPIREGMNEISYNHGFGAQGTYLYRLVIDGKILATRSMVFTAF